MCVSGVSGVGVVQRLYPVRCVWCEGVGMCV